MESTEKPASLPQQYNLKWTNHTNNVLQVFAEHLMYESLVDVTLACEGQLIKAHKMMLSACSPYFNELFKAHTEKHPLIVMYGVKFNDLKMVVEFMYRGEIKVQDEDIHSLLALAEHLQVKGLCNVRVKTGLGRSEQEKPNREPYRPIKRRKTNSGSQGRPAPTEKNANAKNAENNPPKGRKSNKKADSVSSSPAHTSEGHGDGMLLDENEGSVTGAEEDNQEKMSESSTTVDDESTHYLLASSEDGESETMGSKTPGISKQDPTGNLMFITALENVSPKKLTKQILKIPRPPNAFMIFANEWRKKLAVENPGESNKDISIRLGSMWKSLPTAKREFYYEAAKKADVEHKAKYPGYYYSPKEARIRKVTKTATPGKKNSKVFESVHLMKIILPENQNGNMSNPENETEETEEIVHELTTVDITEDDPDVTSE